MNVFDLQAMLTLDKSDYDKKLGDASKSANSFGNKIGSFLSGAAKVTGVVMGAGAAAVGGLTKEAVDAYKNYEQLVGGVETLFGSNVESVEEYTAQIGQSIESIRQFQAANGLKADGVIGPKTKAVIEQRFKQIGNSSQTMMKNANKAFESAGMSANDYMQTAISMSSSMINSLGGDTGKAAEYVDMAISDMSDNANKMGTNMEMIQNAYVGFSRGNFTMLDNLSLGYAGTKQGMQQLIDKANELNKQQGINTKYSIDSYSDIVQAIHTVQEAMNITGTTADEAMFTIEGSARSAGAAWQNVLTAIGGGGDLQQALDGLIKSLFGDGSVDSNGQRGGFVNRIVPQIERAFKGVAKFIKTAGPMIAPALSEMISTLLPGLLESAGAIVATLIETLAGMDWGAIGRAALEAVKTAISTILTTLGVDSQQVEQIMSDISSAISSAFNWIVDNKDIILTAASAILGGFLAYKTVEGILMAVKGAMLLLNAAMSANPIGLIIIAIGALVGAFTYLWNNVEGFKEFWIDAWAKISAWASITWENIKNFATTAWDKIKEVWNSVTSYFSDLWEAIKNGEGLQKLGEDISGLVNAAWDKIKEIWEAIPQWFADLWTSITSNETLKGITDTISGFFTKAWDTIKTAWEAVSGFFSDLWTTLTTNETLTAITDTISGFFTGAWDKIEKVWNTVATFFSGLWTSITSNETLKGIGDTISKLFTGAWDTIKKAWDAAKTFFSDIWTAITTNETLKGISETISKFFSDAWDAITKVFTDVGKWFSENVWKPITDAFSDPIGTFKKIAQDIWNGLTNLFGGEGGEGQSIGEWFTTNVWEKITGVFSGVGEFFKKLGSSIWTSITDGLAEAWEAAKTFVTNAWNDFLSIFGGDGGIGEVIVDPGSKFGGGRSGGGGQTNGGGAGRKKQSANYEEIQSAIQSAFAAASITEEEWAKINESMTTGINDTSKVIDEALKSLTENASGYFDTLEADFTDFDAAAKTASENVVTYWDTADEKLQTTFKSIYDNSTEKFTGVETDTKTSTDTVTKDLASKWTEAQKSVEAVFEAIYDDGSDKFSKMKGDITQATDEASASITSKFSSMKDTLTSTMTDIVNAVKSAVESMKAAMNFTWSVPQPAMPAMPHMSVWWSSNNSPDGKSRAYTPNYNVKWYDQGGIFSSPAIIGVGEKRPEIVGALDDFRKIVREESGIGAVTVNVYGSENQDVNELADAVADRLQTMMKNKRAVFA